MTGRPLLFPESDSISVIVDARDPDTRLHRQRQETVHGGLPHRGGRNGALREQATTGREARFRVESRHSRGHRPRGRDRRPSDRCVGGTKATTSNTPHGRGSRRYANSPRARNQRDRACEAVRGSPWHRVGEVAVTASTTERVELHSTGSRAGSRIDGSPPVLSSIAVSGCCNGPPLTYPRAAH